MAYNPPSTPPPRRRRGLVIAVVVVVVVLIVAVIAISYIASPAPAVQVGFLNIWAPDNVCGLNANPISFYGFNSSTGASQVLDLGMPNYNGTTCVLSSMTTNTSGFTLSDVQVPLAIPGGGTGSMNITVTSPSSSFSGDMNLVVTYIQVRRRDRIRHFFTGRSRRIMGDIDVRNRRVAPTFRNERGASPSPAGD